MKKEEAYIYGDYSSESGRMIRINLRKCQDKPYCKPEKELKDLFVGKHILLLNNQIRFDSNLYGEDSII